MIPCLTCPQNGPWGRAAVLINLENRRGRFGHSYMCTACALDHLAGLRPAFANTGAWQVASAEKLR